MLALSRQARETLMNLKQGLACMVVACLVCGAGFSQTSGAVADPAAKGNQAGDAGLDQGASPKAHVLKGGALKGAPPAATDEKSTAKDGEEASKTSARDSDSTFKIAGDTVFLKSGKKLRGVKVLRVTPSMVEVEYATGQPVMKIPRRMVTSIESENPANAVSAAAGSGKVGGDVMVAEEVSAEFNKKLTAPLPGTPLDFKDQDALTVLKDLADRAQVDLAVDSEAQKVPETQRRLTLAVPAKAALSTMLREEFRKAVPALKFSLQFDKILVTSAEAENSKAAGSVSPGIEPKKDAPSK
jgi:hypothetical protein